MGWPDDTGGAAGAVAPPLVADAHAKAGSAIIKANATANTGESKRKCRQLRTVKCFFCIIFLLWNTPVKQILKKGLPYKYQRVLCYSSFDG
jgi:hypothetical protein